MATTDIDWARLRAAAMSASEHSYSPYSGFPVGAALLAADGEVFTATNVENASYVAGICAETAAVGMFVGSGRGRGEVVAVAVTDGDGADLSPCGRCRQLLHEFGGDDLLVNEIPMGTLLPHAFTPGDL